MYVTITASGCYVFPIVGSCPKPRIPRFLLKGAGRPSDPGIRGPRVGGITP